MRTVKHAFNRFLLHPFIKDEKMFPVFGAAFSVYIPFHDAPAGRIEVTAHLETGSCEIVNFYVCKKLAHMGCGRILLERVEHYMILNEIKKITVVPIGIAGEDFPELTHDELLDTYRHLGFKEQDGKCYLAKVI